ncbi:MAG TPA: hypothetical protein VHK24_14135 [Steroidobacter sp.]|nr:hypothetical protein [Steroidobacter sp.]
MEWEPRTYIFEWASASKEPVAPWTWLFEMWAIAVAYGDRSPRRDDAAVGDEHLTSIAHDDGVAVGLDLAVVHVHHALTFAHDGFARSSGAAGEFAWRSRCAHDAHTGSGDAQLPIGALDGVAGVCSCSALLGGAAELLACSW